MSLVTTDGNYDPAGYRQLDSDDLSSAVGIPGVGQARVALIQCIGENVRWRDDGTDPTANTGAVLVANSDLFYTGNLNKLKFISAGEGEGTPEVNITLYKTAEVQR